MKKILIKNSAQSLTTNEATNLINSALDAEIAAIAAGDASPKASYKNIDVVHNNVLDEAIAAAIASLKEGQWLSFILKSADAGARRCGKICRLGAGNFYVNLGTFEFSKYYLEKKSIRCAEGVSIAKAWRIAHIFGDLISEISIGERRCEVGAGRSHLSPILGFYKKDVWYDVYQTIYSAKNADAAILAKRAAKAKYLRRCAYGMAK